MRLIIILTAFSIYFQSIVFGADYYVSTTGDNGADGSISTPWATPEYGATQLADGDTLYIRGGSYDITTSGDIIYASAIAPSADNTTIKSYPGESVTLIGGTGVAPTNGVIGNATGASGQWRSGVTIDGFTIIGIVVLAYASDLTLQNCDISVGGDSWSGMGQGEIVIVQGVTNCTIKNNKLHDSSLRSGFGNSSLIMAYTALNLTIENNEFYNSAGHGMNLKDTIVNATIRYNYVHDNDYSGLWTANQGNAFAGYTYPQNFVISNNIFVSNNTSNDDGNGAVTFSILTDNVIVHNNTFYNNTRSDYTHPNNAVTSWGFFNNILYNPVSNFLNWPYGATTFNLDYLDYNVYYSASPRWVYQGSAYTSFSSWQTKCQSLLDGCDANSTTSDPSFSNESGSLGTQTDFRLTPSTPSTILTGGRGGEYQTYMGAWSPTDLSMWIGYCSSGYGNCSSSSVHGITIGGGPYTFTKGAGPYTLTLQ